MDTNDTITADSLSDIWPSHVNEIKTNMLNVYKKQSRVKGHQSNWTNLFAVARPANAPTPRTLNINEPMIPPRPTSESATKEEIMLVKNSGAIVANAANEAAATSWAKRKQCPSVILIENSVYQKYGKIPLICSNHHKYIQRTAENNHDILQPAIRRNKWQPKCEK